MTESTLEQFVADLVADVPDEEWAKMPTDFASQASGDLTPQSTDDDGGSSYRRISELGGRFFSGVYEGERRRFYVAEHVNIGKGYMLSMEGVRGTVSECRVTNIERAEPFGIWRRMHGG